LPQKVNLRGARQGRRSAKPVHPSGQDPKLSSSRDVSVREGSEVGTSRLLSHWITELTTGPPRPAFPMQSLGEKRAVPVGQRSGHLPTQACPPSGSVVCFSCASGGCADVARAHKAADRGSRRFAFGARRVGERRAHGTCVAQCLGRPRARLKSRDSGAHATLRFFCCEFGPRRRPGSLRARGGASKMRGRGSG